MRREGGNWNGSLSIFCDHSLAIACPIKSASVNVRKTDVNAGVSWRKVFDPISLLTSTKLL